jgi:amino acid permease
VLTTANLVKMYIGISFISVPKSIEETGIYASLIGFLYVILMNVFCVYILLKARNRFKRQEIVDICDLAAVLYGDWLRPYMSALLICTNAIFLMAYIMFFGTQSDQLMCKTLKKRECGHAYQYSFVIILFLLPIVLLRRLAAVGIFSIVILCFTFLALGIIVYMCSKIYYMTPQEVNDEYHLDLTEDDRNYNYWDTSMLPLFCATMMTLFEGNQQILNVYAEADRP